MDEPCVDILMATYNGEAFLSEQIESIRAQTYSNWRLLISDDCSSDGTLDIIRRYVSMDSRITLVSKNERFGSSKANFFNLLRFASAKYVMLCDQDDYWHASKVSSAVDNLQQIESEFPDEPILTYTDLVVVDEKLNTISDSFYRYMKLQPNRNSVCNLLVQNVATGCTCIMNYNLLAKLMSVEVDLDRIAMHDSWFALVAAIFGKLSFCDARLISYRQHEHNSVGASDFGSQIKFSRLNDLRAAILLSVDQAQELFRVYGSGMDKRSSALVESYATLLNKGKMQRMLVLLKGGYCKVPLVKAIGQLLVTMSMEKRYV